MQKLHEFKQDEKVVYKNDTRTIYDIYPKNKVSLCLIDIEGYEYLDTEEDFLISVNELKKIN
jgi:hypothetical protein